MRCRGTRPRRSPESLGAKGATGETALPLLTRPRAPARARFRERERERERTGSEGGGGACDADQLLGRATGSGAGDGDHFEGALGRFLFDRSAGVRFIDATLEAHLRVAPDRRALAI